MSAPIGGALADDDVAIALAGVQASATGASAVGRVIETGSRAATLAGRDVLVGPIDPCGECDVCRRGGAAVCPTARRRAAIDPLARLVAAARWVVPLGDGLELPAPAAAAVAGDAALAYTMYARTGIGPREPVVVVGATPVTRFLVDVLVAKGVAPVVVVDPARAAWCAHLAARGVATAPDDATLQSRVQAAFAAHGHGARPWRVLVTAADAVALGARLAGPRATLTVLAPIGDLPGELADREVTVIAVAGAHPDLVVETAAMCARGDIDLAGGTSTAPNDELRAIVTPAGG